MNRRKYFDYIEENLIILSSRIKTRGKLNILDLHHYCENFYRDFFNLLFNYNLKNMNAIKQNAEGIDLIDSKNKIIIQISATSSKKKIDSSLDKLLNYPDYHFKFISLCSEIGYLKKVNFKIPNKIYFNPLIDIFDLTAILKKIEDIKNDELLIIYNFIKTELGYEKEIDLVKFDTNIATIINILSKTNWSLKDQEIQINHYEIDKKIELNNLLDVKDLIDNYKIHYSRLEKKYSEFDSHGVNRSLSILYYIRDEYIKISKKMKEDEIFYELFAILKKRVREESSNYQPIPNEELELCIRMIVVDAFIRCKIFKNPEDYQYVITR